MSFAWKRGKTSSRSAHPAVFLSDLRPGSEGIVAEVIGSSRLAIRLRELGIVPGERIRLLRSGCPLIVQVGQSRFCMRRKDAATIRLSSTRSSRSGSRRALERAEAA